MSKNVKVIIIVGLVAAVAALSVGYAALSQTLTINGSATVNANTWGVAFQTASCTKTGSATFSTPTISGTTATLNGITLTLPGDSVTCTIPVKNTGSINANLTNFTVTAPTITPTDTNIKSYISHTVTYDGAATPTVPNALTAGTTKNIVITISFSSSSTVVPSENVSISGLKVVSVYSQA